MSQPRRYRTGQRFLRRFLDVLFRVGIGLIILFLGWTAVMVVLQGLADWKGL